MVFSKRNVLFPARNNANAKEIKDSIKKILALPIIACLVISFTSYTTSMYKGFAFPLLCNDYLSSDSISYITSLSLILVYIFSRVYDFTTKNIDH